MRYQVCVLVTQTPPEVLLPEEVGKDLDGFFETENDMRDWNRGMRLRGFKTLMWDNERNEAIWP